MDQHPDLWTGRRAAYLRGILVTYQVLCPSGTNSRPASSATSPGP
ncbi:hypothetical protein ACFVRD_49160 [Streptomyces sp. NPDC057908]